MVDQWIEVVGGGIPIAAQRVACGNADAPLIAWGHGWGQTSNAFVGLVPGLTHDAHHIVFDLPGFGRTARPSAEWGTEDYADAIAEALKQEKRNGPLVWVGHSFGGRIGLQLAARHPELLSGLIIIAGAGIPPKRTLLDRAMRKGRVYTYKGLRTVAPVLGMDTDALREKFGSRDYLSAGEMRDIFLRAVRENLTDVARDIRKPTCLIYGSDDTEAPPSIGEQLGDLISNSELHVLDGFDHYSILDDGRHQVTRRIQKFLERLA